MAPMAPRSRSQLARWRGVVIGWFCVRLSGVYPAMLTLAFAQIVCRSPSNGIA
jgi:ABC-type branched-subunit amino acid transport system permease subunit